MSEFSLALVLQKKQENPTIDIAKIQIKSERLTPFGGLFSWSNLTPHTHKYFIALLYSDLFNTSNLSFSCG